MHTLPEKGYLSKYIVFLAICLFLSLPLVAQEAVILAGAFEEAFIQAKQKEVRFSMDSKIRKVNHGIRIEPKRGAVIIFKDDLSEEAFQTYAYAGDLVSGKVVLIHAQDYHADRYIAVNLLSGEQHVLIGYPHLLGDKIVCLQGAETDVVPAIEIWQMGKRELDLIKRIHLPERHRPVDLAWMNAHEIVLKDTAGKFWKFHTNRFKSNDGNDKK